MAPTEKLVIDTVSAGVGGGTTGLSEVGMSCCRTGETAFLCERLSITRTKAQSQQVFGGFYSVEPTRLAF